ncbi:MAG: beta-glucosidase [Clostridiales bacterium]|nr:beta-glucosidase [Clostridiales bacterium]
MSLKTKIVNGVTMLVSKVTGLSQDSAEDREKMPKIITPGMPEVLRKVAAEGAVLLKNDNALPLADGTEVSVFGRNQLEWFNTGYGSGGDVNNPYAVSLIEGLKNCKGITLNTELLEIYKEWHEKHPIDHGFWGHWPRCFPEMPLDEEMVKRAAEVSDYAIFTIGRSSGEDRENALIKGSFYLNEDEKNILSLLTKHFKKTIVLLNIGSVIDLSFINEYDGKISAALVVWQGGMESGNAVADILSGAVTPSGKLTDTIAKSYEDYPSSNSFGAKKFNNYEEDIYVGYRWFETFYPESVLYPFGFGLSYTDFDIKCNAVNEAENGFEVNVTVQNIGEKFSGKEVVQIYIEKPCGVLGNPSRILAGFAKTKCLAPNEAEDVTVFVSTERLSSYDDSGETGHKSAYVIEKGDYKFYVGSDVRTAELVYTYNQSETIVYEQLKEAAAPSNGFDIVTAKEKDGKIVLAKKPVSTKTTSLKNIILTNLPKGVDYSGDKGYKLSDVKSGKISMDTFVAQLDLDELEAISRGGYVMNHPLGAEGNASVYGGVLPSLREKGIPAITTTDGPSGIRLKASCSLIPVGTLLACTFDESIVEELYAKVGEEMVDRGSDVLLAPGMNIHRNPLCGRNFEYFSEDPFVSGKMAAAAIKGIQKNGVSACPKHFACNNQEFKRNSNDSRLSERALREIYLKGFEICVKEAKPQNIMTSYNRINGVFGHYHYELCKSILRDEWGFDGCIMTDWWMQYRKSPEFPNMKDNAYRVRGCVDVLMPGGKRIGKQQSDGTLLKTYGQEDGITLGEMQYCAKNVLNFAMHSKAMDK